MTKLTRLNIIPSSRLRKLWGKKSPALNSWGSELQHKSPGFITTMGHEEKSVQEFRVNSVPKERLGVFEHTDAGKDFQCRPQFDVHGAHEMVFFQ